MNALKYKGVFPLMRDDRIWLGASIHSGDRKFYVPAQYPLRGTACGINQNGRRFVRVKGVRWYTNIDHGQRHKPLQLMTMEQNRESNKRLRRKLENDYGKLEYPHYDNL